jgi:hypothetical protein
MKRFLLAAAMIVMFAAGAAMRQAQSTQPDAALAGHEGGQSIRFATLDVTLDSGGEALAAYQIEVKATAGEARIVGIEGGEHAAYREPPYYDPAAMRQERVIIGAFSTAAAAALPSHQTRIATIHLQITGDAEPTFAASLMACATVGGKAIHPTVTLKTGPSR